jgi:hypothetical protein
LAASATKWIAAEQWVFVAHGVSRGIEIQMNEAPERAERICPISVAPAGACVAFGF